MIYNGLARVVADVGRRRRLRSLVPFLVEEFAEDYGMFEEEENENVDHEERVGVLLEDEDVHVLTKMVEEAFIYSCLASLLFTILWFRILPHCPILSTSCPRSK